MATYREKAYAEHVKRLEENIDYYDRWGKRSSGEEAEMYARRAAKARAELEELHAKFARDSESMSRERKLKAANTRIRNSQFAAQYGDAESRAKAQATIERNRNSIHNLMRHGEGPQ